MDKTYDAWRETRAPDWLVAQGCEEAYWLGAWAAWQHQQARIADLTRQLAEERALVEIRESLLDGIDAHIAGGEDTVKLVDKIAAMEREADEYKVSLLRALRERDEARALLAETGHPQ